MPATPKPAAERPRPRWAVLVFLFAFTAGIVALSYYYLFPALRAFVEARERGDHHGARAISATAMLLLAVILLILFCGLILTFRLGRLFFPRPLPPRTTTQYVDAWAESGKRLQAPPEE